MRAQKYEKWRLTFVTAKTRFELLEIQPEQQEAIRFFFEEKNMLVNLPTDFGKTLIFQCLPLSQMAYMIYLVVRLLLLWLWFRLCDPWWRTRYNVWKFWVSILAIVITDVEGLTWKPHLILSVQFAAYLRKPNKQLRGSRSLAGDFRRRWARGKGEISNQRFSKARR